MIRILIVEDQKIMQKYFEYLIESNKNFSMYRQLQMPMMP